VKDEVNDNLSRGVLFLEFNCIAMDIEGELVEYKKPVASLG